MIKLDVEASYRRRTLHLRAIIDTGSSIGLILPVEDARAVGAVLVESETGYPTTCNGVEIPGLGTVLSLGSAAAGVAPVETLVWVVDAPRGEVLVGLHWLGEVGSSVRIGKKRIAIPATPRMNPRRPPIDPATFPWHQQRVGVRVMRWLGMPSPPIVR